MHSIYNQFGAFTVDFDASGEKAMLMILPEMAPDKVGIKPTERHFIYCIHPAHGTCTWYIKQDEDKTWYSDQYPAFIEPGLITWMGQLIEDYMNMDMNDDNN